MDLILDEVYILDTITFEKTSGKLKLTGWETNSNGDIIGSLTNLPDKTLKDKKVYFKLFQIEVNISGDLVTKWKIKFYIPSTTIPNPNVTPDHLACIPFGLNGSFNAMGFGESCETNGAKFKAKLQPDANCTTMLSAGFNSILYMGFIGTDDMRNGYSPPIAVRINDLNNNNFVYLNLRPTNFSNYYELEFAIQAP